VNLGRASGALVREYFAACGQGDADRVAACFTSDAVLYDTNHPPVVGAKAIGCFWANVASRWGGARWEVDTLLEGPASVALEWTMHGERRGRPFTAHGSDHYTLRDGRISEVRQYWVLDHDRSDTGLVGYPYPD
jgi:ketosteroid isomerase-like protein